MKIEYADGNSVFHRLRQAADRPWRDYVGHAFVQQLGDGSLPELCFRHYLIQDFLFLKHFSRAYGLAIYKSDTLADMRAAADIVHALLNVEIGLHIDYCAQYGISQADLEAAPEATATMAYTRYVLEAGLSGDVLDLYVALSPCVVGYGEIGARLAESGIAQDHPYRAWIEMYAGDDYQQAVTAAMAQLDRLADQRAAPNRWPKLHQLFEQATRLEIGFWQMGLDVIR